MLGINSLLKYYPETVKITIAAGCEENTEKVKNSLHSPDDVDIKIIPEIYYRDSSLSFGEEEVKALSDKLLNNFSGTVWWIHNFQLGKNPLFTAAVLHIIRNYPQQKFILHIHDFPECARYDNLEAISIPLIGDPYPARPNIVYCLINSRDRDMLIAAGIPEKQVLLLNNPVESTEPVQKPSEQQRLKLRKDLFACFKQDFPRLSEDGKILFYPVRSIRRKNILEAGLIASASEAAVNLIVSLPGVSSQEKQYSDLCAESFSNGLIPGIFGTGLAKDDSIPSYEQMPGISDLIVSTSVQEGFGYLFINSVQWQIPLFARSLETMGGLEPLLRNHENCFYDRFDVPVDSRTVSVLKDLYLKKLESISVYLTDSRIAELKEIIESEFTADIADYAYLPVVEQLNCLKKAAGSADYRKALNELNKKTFSELYRLLDTADAGVIPDTNGFSPENHALTIKKAADILNSEFETSRTGDPAHVQKNLIDGFAGLDYMRLLYDY